jgi:hypothetical protein
LRGKIGCVFNILKGFEVETLELGDEADIVYYLANGEIDIEQHFERFDAALTRVAALHWYKLLYSLPL